MPVTFSNPRLRAEFGDWPLGGSKRGRCVFQVERSKKGWRVGRTTTGNPKYTTFHGFTAIVDGSDGRTYILASAKDFDFVQVYRSDFFCADQLGRDHSIFKSSEPEYYQELHKMLANVAGGMAVQP